ncbi:MAG: 2-aminophenol 1,6-dioxygenase beta subunit [Firmicutes bacterium ADurb.Bin248]|nr:MAG: 2-aminophenol 1,6-dioxygenase beta subunit [Firmicutes bacterium ADurb.Bin248]HOG00424.1 AmmeMemoRadiSam system protein A [Clostridia bacterium]HPK15160.1 AmmeMemoRadiSam system protein A [Clostridia bacterium]
MPMLAAFAVPHPPVILPGVGRGEENKIRKTAEAYRRAMRRAAELKPDIVVLASPHATLYADYFHVSPGAKAEGSFARFGAPQVKVEAAYDEEFARALTAACAREGFPAGTLGEREKKLDHGTMIPLVFLGEFAADYRLVRVGLSGLSATEHYRFGQIIAGTADALSRSVVFIASGDLSHKLAEDGPYGFAPEGPEFDRLVTRAMANGDFEALLTLDPELCEEAGECGLRSLWIMAGALDRQKVESELLCYEGPFGVGYAVAAFIPAGADEARDIGGRAARKEAEKRAARRAAEDEYVRLARRGVETFVKTGERARLPGGLPGELSDVRAGAFVSIKKDGRLRGCIGTIEPVRESLAEEILRNAVSAASEDPRFEPVGEDELDSLVYSVDVLGSPEPIASEAELDPKRYGVIVERGARRGLLLPDLAGVDTAREQVRIAKQKAGIGEGENVRLYRFEVVRHT